MEEVQPQPPESRWSLGGCLAFFVIVFVLIGLVLPVIGVRHEPVRHLQCGKLQSQLIGALYGYATTENTETWIPADLSFDTTTKGAERGRVVTVRLLETVAASLNIPNVLFKCPASSYGGPSKTMKPQPQDPLSQWGWGKGYGISYAFDWAAPFDPGSQRVLMADREAKAHNGAVMVVFGDAHVKKLKVVEGVTRSQGVLVTEGIFVMPIATASQPDDDIYSTEGDAGDPLAAGKGDPVRAWVK